MASTCDCGNELSESIEYGGISWLAENLLAFQENLCPMELVSDLVTLRFTKLRKYEIKVFFI